MSAPRPLLGGALVILGAAAYGLNIPAARVAALGGVNGANLAVLRTSLFILALALLIPALGRSFRIRDGEGGRIAALGLCSGVVAAGYLSALTYMPVALAVTVFYTFPLILILAAPLTGGRITGRRMLAFAIAFAGIVAAVGPSLGGLDWRGFALAFAAAFASAAMFAITATLKQDRMTLMFWAQIAAMAVLLPAALVSGVAGLESYRPVWPAVLLAAVGFYIGITCQFAAAPHLAPATIGLLFLIEPVVAILSAALALGETLAPLQVIGVTLVLVGLALDVGWPRARRDATVDA
jgi:drug/metabolite transporter (DMT)-like permease